MVLKRIAIDMDEVLADSLGKHLAVCNRAFGTSLTRSDVGPGGVEGCLPVELQQAAEDLLLEPGFFRDLAVMPGAQAAVRALAERYEVFVASAAMEVPTSFADKYAWLREHFDFIPRSHVVFCGDKAVVHTDYLIDDNPRQFLRFSGTPVLFSAPHNMLETRFLRVDGWEHAARVLLDPDRRTISPAAQGELACQASWTKGRAPRSVDASPR